MKAIFPSRKNMFTEVRFICKDASKCMLFQAYLLEKLEKAISTKLVSDFQFELKVIIAKLKEEDIISLRLKKSFKTFESVVKFFEQCHITLDFIHTFCIKFYMVISSTNDEFKQLQENKTYDAGFVIPNDASVNCIDWISALLNCDDVPLSTKLSLLGIDSMMLSIKDDAAADNADGRTDDDDDDDDDDGGDDDELMMLKASRSLAESASYAYSVLSAAPVKFSLHDANCSCKPVIPTNAFSAAVEFPIDPTNPLLPCVQGYGCCQRLDSRSVLEQCIDNGLRNPELTGLWSVIKSDERAVAPTWLASSDIPAVTTLWEKNDGDNGDNIGDNSTKDDSAEDDSIVPEIAKQLEALVSAGGSPGGASVDSVGSASPLSQPSSSSSSNCNISSASQADDDNDAACSSSEKEKKIIITCSKDVKNLSEQEWDDKYHCLKRKAFGKQRKFERTYEDEEHSEAWFLKIAQLENLRKKEIYEKYYDNLFTLIDRSRHFEILERLFELYKQERFALRPLIKIGAEKCKMLYVMPPSEWNWRDVVECEKPLPAIGIKSISKSYVKLLPSKHHTNNNNNILAKRYNLEIQDSIDHVVGGNSISSNDDLKPVKITYNTITVLTLADGQKITFDVQKNNLHQRGGGAKKRKRASHFIELPAAQQQQQQQQQQHQEENEKQDIVHKKQKTN